MQGQVKRGEAPAPDRSAGQPVLDNGGGVNGRNLPVGKQSPYTPPGLFIFRYSQIVARTISRCVASVDSGHAPGRDVRLHQALAVEDGEEHSVGLAWIPARMGRGLSFSSHCLIVSSSQAYGNRP